MDFHTGLGLDLGYMLEPIVVGLMVRVAVVAGNAKEVHIQPLAAAVAGNHAANTQIAANILPAAAVVAASKTKVVVAAKQTMMELEVHMTRMLMMVPLGRCNHRRLGALDSGTCGDCG